MNNLFKFDINKTPFSAKEAYLSIIKRDKKLGGGIWIKSLIRPIWGEIGKEKPSNLLLKIIPVNNKGEFEDYQVEAFPSHLKISLKSGYIVIYFNKYNKLIFDFENSGVIFEYQNYQDININCKNENIKINYPKSNQYMIINGIKKVLNYHLFKNRIKIINEDKIKLKFWVKNLEKPKSYLTFNSVIDVDNDYQNFKKHYKINSNNEELAIYTLWTLSYVKAGNFLDNAIAISKNDMSLTWGWDHLLISLALIKSNPKLIFSGMNVFFETQKDNGMLADALNPVVIVDKFTKPPVYGYYLKKLERNGLIINNEYKIYLYDKLSKLTNWWMSHDKHLPIYLDPFDSGWDNATCFDEGDNFSTPDLISYLIVQMDYLKDLALKLNKKEEAKNWEERKTKLLNKFINEFWENEQFLFKASGEMKKTSSLIRMIPLILENLLPKEIKDVLIKELKEEGHFLTRGGFATESLKSIDYDSRLGDQTKPNAYWRGPMWAPPMYMLVEGLRYFNEDEFADEVITRYLNAIEKEASFYENYDAINLNGYDDIGFGWTVALYLIFKKSL